MRFVLVFLMSMLAVGVAGARDAVPSTIAGKAACVRDGLIAADKEIYGGKPPPLLTSPSEADLAAARDRLARSDAALRLVVTRCLSQSDVEMLGAFSWFEDSGAHCGLRRTVGTAVRRIGGVDVDVVNAAAAWDLLVSPPGAPKPFADEQERARRLFALLPPSERRSLICANLIHSYGPKGDMLPGLIERKR